MSIQNTYDNNHRITQIQQLLQSQPHDCFLNHALALELIKQGNVPEAEAVFIKVLSNNPQYIGSYYHLAKAQEVLQKNEDAIATYTKGIAIAQQLNERHALSELRSALEQLQMDMEDD
jgi:tetratricopeptide (TPR) repeat protein